MKEINSEKLELSDKLRNQEQRPDNKLWKRGEKSWSEKGIENISTKKGLKSSFDGERNWKVESQSSGYERNSSPRHSWNPRDTYFALFSIFLLVIT
jgi:hypothetical protein